MSNPIPAAVPVDGTRRSIFIPGDVANINAITLAEIQSGIDIENYITSDGRATSGEQAVIEDNRHGSSQTFELGGRKARSITLTYTFNLANPDEDEARIALAEGTQGVLVEVLQVDEDADLAASDWYEADVVTCGEQNVVATAVNALDRISQRMFRRGRTVRFKQLAAGA